MSDQWLTSWFQEECDAYMATDYLEETECSVVENSDASALVRHAPGVYPLIDSGASRTVVGRSWARKWLGVTDSTPFIPKETPKRRFKFGSQEKFHSLGARTFYGLAPKATRNNVSRPEVLAIEADVVDLPIPFLLSQDTLKKLGAIICCTSLHMTIGGNLAIPLISLHSGHLSFVWANSPSSQEKLPIKKVSTSIFTAEEKRRTNARCPNSDSYLIRPC